MEQDDAITEFREAEYLAEYPDVDEALANGKLKSSTKHYVDHGASEGRAPAEFISRAPSNVEWVHYASSGFVFIGGWVDDEDIRVLEVVVECGFVRLRIGAEKLVRQRRADVEQALYNEPRAHDFGFFALARASLPLARVDHVDVTLVTSSGHLKHRVVPRRMTEEGLLKSTLGVLGARITCKNGNATALEDVARTLGGDVGELWRAELENCAPFSEHVVGEPPAKPDVSVCTVLYKRPDPIHLQAQLFHGRTSANVEVIYGINSPELVETVVREAEIAHRLHGQSTRIVMFAGNTGFGYANNICARLARSERIVMANPDVSRVDDDWASNAVAEIDANPRSLLGALLLYSDGSIMHDGMRLESDTLPSIHPGSPPTEMLRVHHHAKGAPSWSVDDRSIRSVTAISGAYIMTTKSTFDELSGFAQEYVFGHYEDADLCLRAWQSGISVGVARSNRLYHLEGKGSHWEPHHGGASLFNRCTFTKKWESSQAELTRRAASFDSWNPRSQ